MRQPSSVLIQGQRYIAQSQPSLDRSMTIRRVVCDIRHAAEIHNERAVLVSQAIGYVAMLQPPR